MNDSTHIGHFRTWLCRAMLPLILGIGLTEAQARTTENQIPQSAQFQMASIAGEHDTVYHAVAQPSGFRMTSEAQRVSATFTSTGTRFQHVDHRFGMALRAWGYGENLREAPPASPRAVANRVEYARGPLTEWYVNTPLGIEQGFTLDQRPTPRAAGPLTVALTLSGELTPSLDSDGRTLILNSRNTPALRYSGLTAVDASGQNLRSWLELSNKELRVRVDDFGAQYPITIDPYVQAAKLTMAKRCLEGGVCDDGFQQSFFGHTVAISNDGSTVAMGVAGAVYMFVRPAVATGGWSSPAVIYYAAKLQPPSPNPNFALDLAMTPDAGTIVVGNPEYVGNGSSLYVFHKPAAGWISSTPLFPVARLTSYRYPDANELGTSVSISADGTTIASGAPGMTFTQQRQGAVYVYIKPYSGWVNSTENQRFWLSDGAAYDYWGDSIALSADGKTMVVSATHYNLPGTGFAWVFTGLNNWGTLFQETKLVASNNATAVRFGGALAVSADGATIAVAASSCVRSFACGTYPGGPGAVYMYTKPDAGWYSPAARAETAKLTASVGTVHDWFGAGLAMNPAGTILAASQPNANGIGFVNFFLKPANGWTNATENSRFAVADAPYAIKMSGDAATLVIGAPWVTVGPNIQEGVGYVFTGTPGAPVASINPSSMSFAAQPVGTTSVSKTVTLTNTGSAPLNVTNVATAAPFNGSQNCRAISPIDPGAACSETISFAPTSAGTVTGSMTFTSDSGGGAGTQHTVQLQGAAIKVGTRTVIASVTSTPQLAGKPVTIAYSITPESTTSLTVSGTVTVTASTGESCTTAAPAGSCAITFANAGNHTVTATYSGDGNFNGSASAATAIRITNYAIAVSPVSQTVSGRKANFAVTLSSVNGFAGTLTLSCSGGPAGTTCSMSPASVSLSTATVQVTANVTLPVNAPKGAYKITFNAATAGINRSALAGLTVK